MQTTPAAATKQGLRSAGKPPPPPDKQRVSEAASSAKKGNKRKAPAESEAAGVGAMSMIEEVEEVEEVEDEFTQVFDGSKTTKDIGALKIAVREKYGDLFVSKDEFAAYQDITKKETAAAIKEAVDAVKREILHKMLVLEGGVKKARAAEDELKEKWTIKSSAECLVANKLKNLNDGHSSAATDKEIVYVVHEENLIVCLHCLDANRAPDQCLFRGNKKTSILLHRKPPDKNKPREPAKCCKPGKPHVSDANKTDARIVIGKDYLLTK